MFVLAGWCVDSLVFNLQLIHDGDLPRRFGQHDLNAYIAQRLRSIQQGGRWGWYGYIHFVYYINYKFVFLLWLYAVNQDTWCFVIMLLPFICVTSVTHFWYSFHHPTEVRRLSRCRSLATYQRWYLKWAVLCSSGCLTLNCGFTNAFVRFVVNSFHRSWSSEFVIQYLLSPRSVILETSMVGSRFTVMYFVQRLIACCSRRWLALAITLHSLLCVQLSLPLLVNCTPSKYSCLFYLLPVTSSNKLCTCSNWSFMQKHLSFTTIDMTSFNIEWWWRNCSCSTWLLAVDDCGMVDHCNL